MQTRGFKLSNEVHEKSNKNNVKEVSKSMTKIEDTKLTRKNLEINEKIKIDNQYLIGNKIKTKSIKCLNYEIYFNVE